MSEHGQDPDAQLEHTRDELQEDLERLEDRIGEAKDRLDDRREDAQGAGEAQTAAGEWEDEAPDRPLGDDAEGAREAGS
jgi:hypothetical protein